MDLYSGEFAFPPGEGFRYTSVGYILLQYALAVQAGAKTWEDYDQMSVLPEYLRKDMKHTYFINRGRCSAFKKIGMVHTYESKTVHEWPATQFSYQDYWEKTCANGWGFGNIALSARDTAKFWYEYMGTENIITKEYQELLMHFQPKEHYEWVQYSYGGGVMWKEYKASADDPDSDWKKRTMVGHSGVDYGSQAKLTGFNFDQNVSIALHINTVEGINCKGSHETDGT